MTPREAKDLVGRRIVAVDLQPAWEGDGPNRRLMHDPKITLDDGTVLRFVVEEHPEGSEYGVDIVRSKKPKKRVRRNGRASESPILDDIFIHIFSRILIDVAKRDLGANVSDQEIADLVNAILVKTATNLGYAEVDRIVQKFDERMNLALDRLVGKESDEEKE